MAGGGSPGELQGSTDHCRAWGLLPPSTQAAHGVGSAAAASVRRGLAAWVTPRSAQRRQTVALIPEQCQLGMG